MKLVKNLRRYESKQTVKDGSHLPTKGYMSNRLSTCCVWLNDFTQYLKNGIKIVLNYYSKCSYVGSQYVIYV